jgi:NAD(P)H-nitrite reductase large subunit
VGQLSTRPAPRVEVQYRITPGVEYIKVVLVDGVVKGAMLIGDTDLEETFENLILDGIVVGAPGVADILSPDVDVEDY